MNVDPPVINTLSLCSGAGMLDIGVDLALGQFGIRTQVLAYAEREASAAATLLARMEDESMEPAPIWCDSLECLPREPLRGQVDAIVAGFPCPDFSVAGNRLGIDGERYLLPAILDIAGDVGARWLFLENVRGILSAGAGAAYGEILRTVADCGWTPEWTTLAASEVGASHRRERWFCVAYREGDDRRAQLDAPHARGGGAGSARSCEELADAQHKPNSPEQLDEQGEGSRGATAAHHRSMLGKPSDQLEHPDRELRPREGLHPRRRTEGQGATFITGGGKELADTSQSRLQGQREYHGEAGRKKPDGSTGLGDRELGIFAPGPRDFDGWGRVVADGSFDFLAPATQPGIRLLVDGLALVVDSSRADQLRAAGNGVVPLQAAVAFIDLIERGGWL